MSLTIAVQMDPLESVAIAGDSTFAIMLGAVAVQAVDPSARARA